MRACTSRSICRASRFLRAVQTADRRYPNSRIGISGASLEPPVSARRVLGAAQTEHLAGIERGAPGRVTRAFPRLVDGVAIAETRAAPDVDGDAAVSVLVADREGE